MRYRQLNLLKKIIKDTILDSGSGGFMLFFHHNFVVLY